MAWVGLGAALFAGNPRLTQCVAIHLARFIPFIAQLAIIPSFLELAFKHFFPLYVAFCSLLTHKSI